VIVGDITGRPILLLVLNMSEETHAATYASYLKIDELPSLQQPFGRSRNTTLFIVIHRLRALVQGLLHELIASSSCWKRRLASFAAHLEAHPHDPEGDGGAADILKR
jgi:hypothetical protein